MATDFAVRDEVREVCAELAKAGFEAYLVGGCVRDMILKREPKDWDVATNAKPEEVQKLFKDSVYENDFGTVLVKTEKEDEEKIGSMDPRLRGGDREKSDRIKAVEVTTYRIEGKYSDKRHPDEVKFAKTIEEDLSRRDFTVNAMAMKFVNLDSGFINHELVDPFDGQVDLKKGIIRTVGNAEERFGEDALRLMRAVRFAVELDFEIDLATRRAIEKMAGGLEEIAKERVRDELQKMLMARNAAKGIILLEELDLLRYVLPELREGLGVGQNKHHIYSVFEHDVKALDYTAKQGYSLPVRMAALLHDVGKPRAKVGDGPDSTFYQHEYISAKMAVRALDRLRFSKDLVEQVAHLVRRHMFHYNVGEISPAGVRRFVVRVGPENIDDLLKVREADRIGSGVAKAVPYKLRHLLFMIDKVKRDPLSPKMLKVSGDDVMKELDLPAGPRIGWILAALLEEVLDDPKKNDRDELMDQMKKLNKLTDAKLKLLAESSKNKKDELEGEAEEEIKKKHHVS
ncbi:MAG: HD domain-containing protein [Minisyncoccia bacterium]